jgi:hypothetical protein
VERPGPASLGVGGGGMASIAFTPAYINSLLGLVFLCPMGFASGAYFCKRR